MREKNLTAAAGLFAVESVLVGGERDQKQKGGGRKQ